MTNPSIDLEAFPTWIPISNSTSLGLLVFIAGSIPFLAIFLDWISWKLITQFNFPLQHPVIRFFRTCLNHQWIVDLGLLLGLLVPFLIGITFGPNISTLESARFHVVRIGLVLLVLAACMGIHYSPYCLLLPRQRLLRYHGFFAQLGIIFISIHGILYLNEWIQADFLWPQLQRSMVPMGLTAWILLLLIALTSSIPWIRIKFYSLFWSMHQLLLGFFIVFAAIHRYKTISYGIIILVIFFWNKFGIGIQLARSMKIIHIDSNKSSTSQETRYVRYHITSFSLSPRPNRIVYLGRKPISTFHPFTVQFMWKPAAPYLVIDIYRYKGWTNQIEPSTPLYGFIAWAPSPAPIHLCTQSILIAGGSGITTIISWLSYLAYLRSQQDIGFNTLPTTPITDAESGEPHISPVHASDIKFPRSILLIWCVRNVKQHSHIEWNEWIQLLPELRIKIIDTSHVGRPDFDSILPIPSTAPLYREIGLVCGPASLTHSIQKLKRPWCLITEPYRWQPW